MLFFDLSLTLIYFLFTSFPHRIGTTFSGARPTPGLKTKLVIIAFFTLGLVLLFTGAGVYNSGEYGEEGLHTGKDLMLCR